MARTARTHKETVRLNFTEAERPDPSEERTVSEAGEGGTEASHQVGTPLGQSEEIEVEAEVLYNDDFGNEVPRNEGVKEPATPPNLAAIDYDRVPMFSSIMSQALTAELIRQYP